MKNKNKEKIICPTCRQDMKEMSFHDGFNNKDCPQCGQGVSWRKAKKRIKTWGVNIAKRFNC